MRGKNGIGGSGAKTPDAGSAFYRKATSCMKKQPRVGAVFCRAAEKSVFQPSGNARPESFSKRPFRFVSAEGNRNLFRIPSLRSNRRQTAASLKKTSNPPQQKEAGNFPGFHPPTNRQAETPPDSIPHPAIKRQAETLPDFYFLLKVLGGFGGTFTKFSF